MTGRHSHTSIERAVKTRHDAPVKLIALCRQRPPSSCLVTHVAKGAAEMLVGEPRVESEEPLHVDRHVLEFRKPIEVPGKAGAHVELETVRQVEDRRLLLAHLKDITFAAGLGGTKE